MATLRIYGNILPSDQDQAKINPFLPTAQVIEKFQISRTRDDGNVEERTVDEDEVVELQLSNGIKRWILVSDLQEELVPYGLRSATEDDAIIISADISFQDKRSRGIITEAILEGLKLIKIDLAEKPAKVIVSQLDNSYQKEAGLKFCRTPFELIEFREDMLEGEGPLLLLLHGTISSTELSFGELVKETDEFNWQKISQLYKGRILAFEHKTLTEGPLENAIALLKALPPEIEVDILSSSRGGLIGEIISRGGRIHADLPFDSVDKDVFKWAAEDSENGEAFHHDINLLEELNKLLKEKKISIRRFMRVACPAAGTTLVSDRLDRYLTALVNIVGFIPFLQSSELYDFITAFTLAVVKKRLDANVVPGLAAMSPDAPLIKILNRSDIYLSSELFVIAGDSEGTRLKGKLKSVGADLFFRQDNDLVIDTKSMLGGAKRWNLSEEKNLAEYYLDKGDQVNHFRYFHNLNTRKALWKKLSQVSTPLILTSRQIDPILSQIKPINFFGGTSPKLEIQENSNENTKLRADQTAYIRKSRVRYYEPTVFIIPDRMASHLSFRQNDQVEKIWLDYDALANGKLSALNLTTHSHISASAVLESNYKGLIRSLEQSHKVIPFPYDWRLSLFEEANRLSKQFIREMNDSNLPVRILAHGSGGVLARLMFLEEFNPGLMNKWLAREGNRFLMLGTPNRGSIQMLQVLAGMDAASQSLAYVDTKNKPISLQKLFLDFPGLLELLPFLPSEKATPSTQEQAEQREGSKSGNNGITPSYETFVDYFHIGNWERLLKTDDSDWKQSFADKLSQASSLGLQLASQDLSSEKILYVAGQADTTPFQLKFESKRDGKPYFHTTPLGDGRISWYEGVLPDLRNKTWLMTVEHGRLPSDPSGFEAMYELLSHGDTHHLQKRDLLAQHEAEPLYRSQEELRKLPFQRPKRSIFIFPGHEELEANVLGISPISAPAEIQQPVGVKVTHGNLKYAEFPVMVGHFKGDGLVSAERDLDHYLNRKLSQRHEVDTYPGDLESHIVILQNTKNKKPEGGIVIGLGAFGELTAGGLLRSMSDAMLTYVLTKVEQEGYEYMENQDFGISCLLIGSEYGGLSLRETIRTIFDSIAQANNRLKQSSYHQQFRIGQLEIIELDQDKAIRALQTIDLLIGDNQLSSFVLAEKYLQKNREGQLSMIQNKELDWWQRLQVTAKDPRKKNVKLSNHPFPGFLEPALHLYFTSLTDRARAEVDEIEVRKSQIEDFIEMANRSQPNNPQMAATLFEALMPNVFKTYAQEQKKILWIVDKVTAEYPWELMRDPQLNEAEPLSVKAGMLRQLSTRTFRNNTLTSEERNVLVVGDPVSNLAELPGALKEAEMVIELINKLNSFHVFPVLRKKHIEVTQELFARPYRILHLAGHGLYMKTAEVAGVDPQLVVSGMVIGKNSLLTPGMINQMRIIPDLVFINCCHLGQVEMDAEELTQHRHKLAANLGTQLIEMGVRAVIAAGWAVDDNAAYTFANEFYDQMFKGANFGEAVRDARELTYRQHPRTNTWGAYQCYGDPFFTLDTRYVNNQPVAKRYYDSKEVIIDLGVIKNRSNSAAERDFKSIKSDIKEIEKSIPIDWLQNEAQLVEALVLAYSNLYMHEEVIYYVERLKAFEQATYSVKLLEQVANHKVHYGLNLVIQNSVVLEGDVSGEQNASLSELTEKGKTFIDEAIEELKDLLQIHKTGERFNLLGSAYKRKAISCVKQEKREKALIHAIEYYLQGFKVLVDKPNDRMYPLMNHLMVTEIAKLYGWKKKEDPYDPLVVKVLEGLEVEMINEFTLEADQEKNFWSLVFPASLLEFNLIKESAEYIHTRLKKEMAFEDFDLRFEEKEKAIYDIYKAAWTVSGSNRHRRSILDQYDSIIYLLKIEPKHTQSTFEVDIPEEVIQGIRRLYQKIERMRFQLGEILSD